MFSEADMFLRRDTRSRFPPALRLESTAHANETRHYST